MTNKLVGQIFQLKDRVYKKAHTATTFSNERIYGLITEVLKEKNKIGRTFYYYWIKHEGTGKLSKHAQHRLAAAPLPPS